MQCLYGKCIVMHESQWATTLHRRSKCMHSRICRSAICRQLEWKFAQDVVFLAMPELTPLVHRTHARARCGDLPVLRILEGL